MFFIAKHSSLTLMGIWLKPLKFNILIAHSESVFMIYSIVIFLPLFNKEVVIFVNFSQLPHHLIDNLYSSVWVGNVIVVW